MLSKNNLALIGLSLGGFVASLDFTIINTALPAIQQGLDLSLTQLQWVMNGFVMAICVLSASMGRFGDLFGRRLVLYIGHAIFAVACLLGGLAESATLLIIARVFQGVGIAIVIPSSLALLASIYPKPKRPQALAIWTSIRSIAMAIGPVIGGILVGQLNWRWIFYVNLPIIAICLIICFFTLDESYGKKAKIDWHGLILLSIAMAALTLAIIELPDLGWRNSTVLLLFLSAIISAILFSLLEKKEAGRIVNFNLFKNPIFASAALINFLILFFAYVIFFLMPLYLQNIKQFTPEVVGLLLLPISGGMVVASTMTAYLSHYIKNKWFIYLGLALFPISAAIQFYFSKDTSVLTIIIALACMGLAWGITNVVSIAMGLSAFPEHLSGEVSGILSTLRNLGGTMGLAIAISIFRVEQHNYVKQQLSALHINLSHHQITELHKTLANQSKTQLFLQHYMSVQQVTALFNQAFMEGIYAAMLLLIIFTWLVMLIIFILNKKMPRDFQINSLF